MTCPFLNSPHPISKEEAIEVLADYLRDQPYLDDSMSDLERERARGRAAEASQ